MSACAPTRTPAPTARQRHRRVLAAGRGAFEAAKNHERDKRDENRPEDDPQSLHRFEVGVVRLAPGARSADRAVAIHRKYIDKRAVAPAQPGPIDDRPQGETIHRETIGIEQTGAGDLVDESGAEQQPGSPDSNEPEDQHGPRFRFASRSAAPGERDKNDNREPGRDDTAA